MPHRQPLRVGTLVLVPVVLFAGLGFSLPSETLETFRISRQPALLAPIGPEPVLLITGGGETRVAWGEGRTQQRVRLPRHGRLTRFEATGRGWVAAGTVSRDVGQELLVVTGEDGSQQQLPPPPGRRGALRHDPVPLVQGRHLVGLAWLQGDAMDRLAVWAADWDGASWLRPRQVALPGPGSQLALSAAVLDDSSWLLAWSRYDGSDDEIYWSVRRQESWSQPQRAAAVNEVPDILPALVATSGGALLSWNQWDGESYRLLLSRWNGGGWSTPEEVGGRGSLYPSWRRSASGAHLLFRQAIAGTWEVLEVDAAGQPIRQASIPGPPDPAPVLVTAAETSLLFPDGRAEVLSWMPVLAR